MAPIARIKRFFSGQSLSSPSLTLHIAKGQILIAGAYQDQGHRPWLVFCNLTLTSCSNREISGTQGNLSGRNPHIVANSANDEILVVSRNESQLHRPWLFRMAPAITE